jgi:iron complex outermembrane receptor protein
MKKIFLLLLVFKGITAFAQVNSTIMVFNATDSSGIKGAKITIEFLKQKTLKTSGYTDSNGLFPTTLASEAFNLSVTKDGFKPLFVYVPNAGSRIDIYLKALIYDGEEITVNATRAADKSGTSFTLLSKKELGVRNFGQDIPMILQGTPSTVASSDAGTGIGYTGIKIRGVDPTRINVTINGVPLNDAESQGVFWVNMPDFASGVENIQVQRGVGTSTNGAGAFGASINIKTDKFSEVPFAKLSMSQGSFNTSRQAVKFGTGKMNHNWYAEGRLSWIKSDGFIDRAASDLQAWSMSVGRKTNKSLFQVNAFSGAEKTYQAWNGVPMVKFNNDTAGVDSLINYLWYDSSRAQQLRNSDASKYNYYNYKNETDNYKQSHLQVIYNRSLKKNRNLNLVLHGTLGKGYYENFEPKTDLVNFMDTPVIFYGKAYTNANLIHQRWLDNSFGGLVFSYTTDGAKSDQTIGGAVNVYNGKHFGKVIWHEFMDLSQDALEYYNDQSLKKDANLFWKLQQQVTKEFSGYADLQIRYVSYDRDYKGVSNLKPNNYFFVNPKLGFQYQPKSNLILYASYGRASREPLRDDFINSVNATEPKPEFMNNIEAAIKSNYGDWKYTFTGFYMGYKDQLALTGKINDVGGYTRVNIPKSYRAGIEMEVSVAVATWIDWSFNFTLSQNKIKKFTEFVDDYTNGGQVAFVWENTDMALSPNKILGSQFTITATKTTKIIFLSKMVGRQYLDNTQTSSRSLNSYVINDVLIHFEPKIPKLKSFGISGMVNNISNQKYAASGYNFSGMIADNRRDFSFVYPQAGINFLVRVEIGF